jgi:hypothetical protein
MAEQVVEISKRTGKPKLKRKPKGYPKTGGRVAGVPPSSRVLLDMNHVYREPEEKDKTPGQKMFRQMLKDSPKDFLIQLTRLEAAERLVKAKAKEAQEKKELAAKSTVPGGTVDDGLGRAMELLERLLQEWDSGTDRKDGK